MKAPASCARSGAGVTPREAGRSCHSALHARMPPVQKLPLAARPTSAPPSARTQGKGLMPDGTLALLLQGQADFPLHGLLDLLELHRAAGNRGGEDPRGRAVPDRAATSAAASPPASAPSPRPPRSSPAPTASSSAWAASASMCLQGLQDGGRRQDHRRRSQRLARKNGAAGSA